MNEKNAPKIPAKWLVIIVFALIAYGLGQPVANRKFGWKLPSLASLLGQKEAPPARELEKPSLGSEASTEESVTQDDDQKGSEAANSSASKSSDLRQTTESSQQPSEPVKPQGGSGKSSEPTQSMSGSIKETASKESASKDSGSSKAPISKPPVSKPPATKPAEKDSNLLYGLLKEIGNESYVSPAGLRYTRGSEEGHRLKHLARHLEDQPDRPGKHGVFDGDMTVVLRLLDEAYERASSGAKGTSKKDEDGRTVYEVTFTKPIGYIGGRDGARQKNPDAKRLRMVVDDNRLITAFPF